MKPSGARSPVRNVELATRSFNAIAALPGWREGQAGWEPERAWLSVPEHMKLVYCYEKSPDLRSGRLAAPERRSQAVSCRPPAPARARRMPGSTMGARCSICSATASCCCSSAPLRPMCAGCECGRRTRRADARGRDCRCGDRRAVREAAGAGAPRWPCRLARRRLPGRSPAPSSIASAARCNSLADTRWPALL